MSTWKISPNTLHQDLGNEIVLLNLTTSVYFSLHATGKRIWQLAVEHDGDMDAVVAAMCAEYGVAAERVRADAAALREQLLEAGLLVAE
jgi:hypothetical protein